MNSEMKQNILFIVLLFAAIGISVGVTWYYKGSIDESDFQNRILRAPVSVTKKKEVKEIPLPDQKKQVQNAPKITPEHKQNADSIFQAGMALGVDSMKAIYERHTAPEDTTIIFDKSGILHHTFYPISRMSTYDWHPFPAKEVTYREIDSVFVPVETKVPWYDHWYIGAIGTGITFYGASRVLK